MRRVQSWPRMQRDRVKDWVVFCYLWRRRDGQKVDPGEQSAATCLFLERAENRLLEFPIAI